MHAWLAVASSINTEFRRFDKFATGVNPGHRIIVTDSWLLRDALPSATGRFRQQQLEPGTVYLP